ncbi:hypothetical protein Mapa_014696 [Marchantia paleacea]|nr:hypothetical protein Mapa_014696 [Marchantia paleacea]
MEQPLRNWAGNYQFSSLRIHRPGSVEEVQALVLSCKKLRVLGTAHSFNGIADTDGDFISLERMNRVLIIDESRSSVTFEAGLKYGDLCQQIHSKGYALRNLASLPHTTIAGAVATATHGSGDRNGNLATAVSGLEIVTGRGQVVTLSKETNGIVFEGAVVALGGLGVVTKLTLSLVPAFEVRQLVYQRLSLSVVEENFDRIFSGAYSVSLFTEWKSSTIDQMWLKQKLEKGSLCAHVEPELFGATLAKKDLHPITDHSPIHCTKQMGVPGPWYDRLPHFRMNFTPSSGEELQAEYLIPRHNAIAALKIIGSLKELIAPVLQICELRTVAGDILWMSPFFRQPCLAIHFTLIKDWQAVSKVLPIVDEALKPLQPRPHWGKLFTMSQDRVKSSYCKLPDFRQLMRLLDPEGKFRNKFLETYINDNPTSKL